MITSQYHLTGIVSILKKEGKRPPLTAALLLIIIIIIIKRRSGINPIPPTVIDRD